MLKKPNNFLRSHFTPWFVAFAILPVSFTATAAQSPYYGNPFSLPTKIEAEAYDFGGEGVAYHDSTTENEPNGARASEGVDVEQSSLASGGLDVGWVTPGEWLEYSVAIPREEQYQFDIRYAADGPGGEMHIEIDGVDVTGPITLLDTGGWQTWSTVSVPNVLLAQKSAVMRLVFDEGSADGWLANIDYVEVASMESLQRIYSGRTEGTRVEVEHYDEGGEGVAYHDVTPENEPGELRDDGVDIELTSDVGGGYDVGWIRPGEWLEYRQGFGDIRYTFFIRHASQGPGGTMHIEVAGEDVTGPIVLPDTGGWQNWQTLRLPGVAVPDYRGTMRLVFDAPGPSGWLANLNYLDIKPGPDRYSGPPAPIPGTIQAEYYDVGGQDVAYYDSTPENEGGGARLQEGVDVEPTSDTGGGMDVGWITPGEWLYYTINVFEPGNFDIEVRYAADGFGGVMHIEFDGADKTGPIILPDSGGWQVWKSFIVRNVPLGNHRLMRLVFDEGNADGWLANINYIKITRSQ